ncbi:hypothetical protein [Candidatus Nitrosopumilus sp. SW]|uniref:hypothetical protein n=1 Tax=Candidatus Nitrosopumilus sp. SW TaxID=2508726 RepID=UPI00163A7119|nr:hypothetical protein [Candidatus Nitrosopumilus sp. SW]
MVGITLNSDSRSENTVDEKNIEEEFEHLFPEYDYSVKSSFHEKDLRKKKRMKTVY